MDTTARLKKGRKITCTFAAARLVLFQDVSVYREPFENHCSTPSLHPVIQVIMSSRHIYKVQIPKFMGKEIFKQNSL